MKLFKKATSILALCLAMNSSLCTTIYGDSLNKVSAVLAQTSQTTSGSQVVVDKANPTLEVTTYVKNDKTYLRIKASDDQGIKSVTVNGEDIGYSNGTSYEDYWVMRTGNYTVVVTDKSNKTVSHSVPVTIKDEDPELSLSKRYKNSKWYLIIDYKDNGEITNLTVNDEEIGFDKEGGTCEYRVTKSKKYKVKVTDCDGNIVRESIEIDVDEDDEDPELELSKKYKNGKWYLVIDASDDNKIEKVTVNGSKIDFDEDGDEVDYRVTKSDTYKVVVTDNSNQTTKDSLYIDVDEEDEEPTLKLSQTYKNGSYYLVIDVDDDNEDICELEVNGESLSCNSSGEKIEYRVTSSGYYKVQVEDECGNKVTESLFVDIREAYGNYGSSDYIGSTSNYDTGYTTSWGNNSSIVDTSALISGSQVIFTQGSTNWSKNQVMQPAMDVAPTLINSRICLPLRYVAYALGIDEKNVVWDSKTKTARIIDGNKVVEVKLYSKTMKLNGTSITIDTAPAIVNSHIMLPISQIIRAFSDKNIKIDWDNNKKQAIIIAQ